MREPTFRFLYRETEGAIGPALWRQASAWPVGIALAMTAVAWALAPGPRDLGTQPFFSLSILAVHAYFIVYGFALFVLAVAEYFVSAKRFNDLGKSPAWAGLAPFCLLLAGAVFNYWYWPPFAARGIGTTLFRFLFFGPSQHRPAAAAE